jgi:hypothetical protein
LGTSWEQTKNFSSYEILSVLFSVLSVYSTGSCAVSKAVTQQQGRVTALVDLVAVERAGRAECACVVLPVRVLLVNVAEGGGMRRKGYSLVPLPGCWE